jgi:hypothetical protein
MGWMGWLVLRLLLTQPGSAGAFFLLCPLSVALCFGSVRILSLSSFFYFFFFFFMVIDCCPPWLGSLSFPSLARCMWCPRIQGSTVGGPKNPSNSSPGSACVGTGASEP